MKLSLNIISECCIRSWCFENDDNVFFLCAQTAKILVHSFAGDIASFNFFIQLLLYCAYFVGDCKTFENSWPKHNWF